LGGGFFFNFGGGKEKRREGMCVRIKHGKISMTKPLEFYCK
jgi:hypothetical protein